ENKTYKEWPFDQKFHWIINLAIGGFWGGVEGVDDSILPVTFEVDYVRVYDLLKELYATNTVCAQLISPTRVLSIRIKDISLLCSRRINKNKNLQNSIGKLSRCWWIVSANSCWVEHSRCFTIREYFGIRRIWIFFARAMNTLKF